MYLLLFLNGAPLWANPTGGTVTSGSATISNAGTTTTINQSTGSAIINWQTFSIASNEATKFFVPNASSVTLNRVTGGNPSAIYGQLTSNGRLILVNPNGIVVGPGGRIDTAGFIGSTLAITDDDFLKGGDMNFVGTGSGTIDNQGTIHASGGDVYLIASQVGNSGSINAPHGNVGLAAGTDILFQQAGDQHLYVQANPLATTRATGVTNSGTIRAATAELKAAGGNAYALAINNTGQIAATGFKKINGQVYLMADGGDITNSGRISASDPNGNGGTIVLNGHGTTAKGTVINSGKLIAAGHKKGTTGGTVELLGNQVGVTDFGLVDVSGDAGGGTALLGGDSRGANPAIPDADQTYLGPDAKIEADALTLGNGGKVVLWGNQTTQAYGAISVRGGAQGGNGGSVETSAPTLDAQTSPDLSAPHGNGGRWLLDPSNIDIDDQVTTTPGFAAPFTITSGNVFVLNQNDLLNALLNGDVTLDASTGTGTSAGVIEWTQSGGTPFDITLSSARTLTLNAPSSIDLEGITINATGSAGLSLILNSSINGAGAVALNNSSIALNGGSFTANGNGYVSSVDEAGNIDGILVNNSTINAQGGNIILTGNGGYGNPGSFGIQPGNGVDVGGGQDFTDLIETSGSGNITITATLNQNITTSWGLTAFNMDGGSNVSGSATISVASGLLSITGNVDAGTASGSQQNDANVTGVDIFEGALVEATSLDGSVTLSGNTSAATSLVFGTDTQSGNTGVEIDGGTNRATTVSVMGPNSRQNDGILTITGTSGTVDTSNSTTTGNTSVPFSNGVNIAEGAQITAGGNATIHVTGTGGPVITTGAFTGGSTGVSFFEGSQLTMGSGGTLTITGFGGSVNAGNGANAGDAQSTGVEIDGGSTNEILSLATGGSITITGTGGGVDESSAASVTGHNTPNSQGVSLDSGVRLEAAGTTTITLMGTAGNITAGSNTDGNAIGVNIGSGDGSSVLTTSVSSGSGQITITGFGGSSPSIGMGAEVHGFNGRSATVESTTGNISITGTGGAGYAGNGTISGNSVPNFGVAIIDDATLMTGGSGTISLTGTGSANSYGVHVHELVGDATLDASPVIPVITAGGAFTANALSGTGVFINATVNAASATLGSESTPGNVVVISSGNLAIFDSTITLTGGAFTGFGTGEKSLTTSVQDANGIDILDSTINAQGGSIALTGDSGYVNVGSGQLFMGNAVIVRNQSGTSEIETTGAGNITITATVNQSITSSDGLTGFDMYGTGNSISLGAGLLSITGNILNGTASGTGIDGDSVVGIEVGGGATLSATATNGSITLNGDVSGATAVISGSVFSFIAGVEVGGAASGTQVTVQNGGTITIEGTGTSVDASGYTGTATVFTTGVQIDEGAVISGQANSHLLVTGTQNSGTTATDADLNAVQVDGGAQLSVGNGGTLVITGTATGTSVTASATGNHNDGTDMSDSGTSVTVGTSGTLALTGESGTIDASADTDSNTTDVGLDINGSVLLSAGSGTSVTLVGTSAGATTTTSSAGQTAGINLASSTLTLGGGNVVNITGTAGSVDDGTNDGTTSEPAATVGVNMSESASITMSGTGGSILIIGNAGALTTTNASVPSSGDNFPEDAGIEVSSGSDIEVAGSSTIELQGFGGNVASGRSGVGSAFGISLNSGGAVTTISSQTGSLTLTGVAGASPNLGIGVALHGFDGGNSLVETTTGTITVTGTGGSGNSGIHSFNGFYEPNDGVILLDHATVETTAGSIALNGTDGSGDVNGAGIAALELSAGSVDSAPVVPQIEATSTSVTMNALSSGDINLADSSLSAHSASLGLEGHTANITLGVVNVPALSLEANGAITQTGTLTTSFLTIFGASSVVLDNSGNNISELEAVTTSGSLSIFTDPGLALNGAIDTSGSTFIETTGGNLTMNSGSSIDDSASGTDVTLVTTGNFVNNAGSGAVQDSGGNYYIYSTDPSSTTLGGIPVDFTQYNTSYPASSVPSGNGVFFADANPGSGGGGSGGSPPLNSGGPAGSGGNQLPPALNPPTTTITPTTTPPGQNNGGTQPPPAEFSGNGAFSQTDSQSGGLASATGSGGDIGSGDAAQMNNGEMNNVANPAAASALDSALSIIVHNNLEDALKTLGDFADANWTPDSDHPGAADDSNTKIIGSGDVVEIGDGGVKNIPLKSAPKPLQDALGNGVLQGLQPGAGH